MSSHRVNYAHLDPEWSEAGRSALRDLLGRLAGDGAMFLTDAELRSLHERAWSLRAVGGRGALLRYYGAPRERVRFPAPAGAAGVSVRGARADGTPRLAMEGREVVAELAPGEYQLEWSGP